MARFDEISACCRQWCWTTNKKAVSIVAKMFAFLEQSHRCHRLSYTPRRGYSDSSGPLINQEDFSDLQSVMANPCLQNDVIIVWIGPGHSQCVQTNGK